MDGNLGFVAFWSLVSGVTVIVLGVEPTLIVLACIGSLVTISARRSTDGSMRAKSLSVVSWAAAFIGAAVLANAIGNYFEWGPKTVNGLALFLGFGGTPILQTAVDSLTKLMQRMLAKASGVGNDGN